MRARSRSRGFALLMVLMLIATASVVGIAYIYGAQVKTAGTCNLMLAAQARYLAESGLQHGLYSLQTRATPFGSEAAPNGPYHTIAGDGGYVFHIKSTSNPNDYQIVATGTEGGISQTISMTVRLTSQYAEKMIDIAPTYWWRLGDSGLTAKDEKALNDGTYVNAVTRGAEGAFLGDVDTAVEFGGGNDYINLGTMPKLDDGRVTFGCWVRADSWASPKPRLMSRSSGTSWDQKRWELQVGVDRKLIFTLRLNNLIYQLCGYTKLELGEWYFVVGVFNRNTRRIRLYLNGEPEAAWNNVADANIKDNDTLEAWIGDCPTVPGQRPWAGAIDEAFIIKGTALTPETIKELFDARIPGISIISWDN